MDYYSISTSQKSHFFPSRSVNRMKKKYTIFNWKSAEDRGRQTRENKQTHETVKIEMFGLERMCEWNCVTFSLPQVQNPNNRQMTHKPTETNTLSGNERKKTDEMSIRKIEIKWSHFKCKIENRWDFLALVVFFCHRLLCLCCYSDSNRDNNMRHFTSINFK